MVTDKFKEMVDERIAAVVKPLPAKQDNIRDNFRRDQMKKAKLYGLEKELYDLAQKVNTDENLTTKEYDKCKKIVYEAVNGFVKLK
jgi:hypothetical protein